MIFKEGKIRSQNGIKQRYKPVLNRPDPPKPINDNDKIIANSDSNWDGLVYDEDNVNE